MRRYIALESIDAGCVVVVDPEKRTVRKGPYIARGVDVLNQSRNIPDWARATPPEHTNCRSVITPTPKGWGKIFWAIILLAFAFLLDSGIRLSQIFSSDLLP